MKEELKAADAAMFDVRSLTFDVLELKYRNHEPWGGEVDSVKPRRFVLRGHAPFTQLRDGARGTQRKRLLTSDRELHFARLFDHF